MSTLADAFDTLADAPSDPGTRQRATVRALNAARPLAVRDPNTSPTFTAAVVAVCPYRQVLPSRTLAVSNLFREGMDQGATMQ